MNMYDPKYREESLCESLRATGGGPRLSIEKITQFSWMISDAITRPGFRLRGAYENDGRLYAGFPRNSRLQGP